MDTFSMIDEDPTLPIDFDQSTNLLKYLNRDRKDDLEILQEVTHHEDTISISESDSKPVSARNDPNEPDRATMRDHEEIIGALKKENFGLKLRIYFLEERLQMAYEEDTEDILKNNIELKVNIEQLKKDLTEKQHLLIKASKAMETISVESEKHINGLKEEFTKQFNNMRDQLQDDLDQRDKEIAENNHQLEELNKKMLETEQLRLELESHKKECSTDSGVIEDMKLKYKEVEGKYEKKIQEKDMKIKELMQRDGANDEISGLKALIAEKDTKIHSLQIDLKELASQSPDRSNQHYEVLYNKLEAENIENEKKIKDLSKELRAKANLVQELKDYMNKTDRVNKELRNSIHDKETEKHRSSMSLQEHIKWKLNNRLRDLLSRVRLDMALSNKEKEIGKYREEIQKLEQLLRELQAELDEAKDKLNQIDAISKKDKSEALAALLADLQEKDFVLKKNRQALLDRDKDIEYFNDSKLRAEKDLQELLAQKNNEIQSLTEDLKMLTASRASRLHDLEDQCQRLQEDAQLQLNAKDKLIQRLSNAIRNKDLFIQELATPQENLDTSSESLQDNQSFVLQKLRTKIKDMDSVIEANLDDKFKAMNEKDQELLELKRVLRGKDREIDTIKANVMTCEGLINHLEDVGKEKDNILMGLKNAIEMQGSAFKVSMEAANDSVEDHQRKIIQLTTLLGAKEKEVTSDESNEELDVSISQKRIEEITAERDTALARNETNRHKFISVLNENDQHLKELFKMIMRLSDDKSVTIKQLNSILQQKNYDVTTADDTLCKARKEFEAIQNMQQDNANEKDHTIQELVKSGQEKDRLISELREHMQTKPRQLLADSSTELENLKGLCHKLDDELQEKKDELKEERNENKRIRDELRNQQRLENIEITLKFDNMKLELESKENQLKQARDKLEDLKKEIQDLQNSKEDLVRQCKEKDSKLHELQNHVNVGKDVQESLQKLQEQKVNLEQRLGDLHAEANSLKSSKENVEKKLLESMEANEKLAAQLEDLDTRLQSSVSIDEADKLKSEIHYLRLELEKEKSLSKRNSQIVADGVDEVDSSDLKELLKIQLEQQKKLLQAAEDDRQRYQDLITELNSKNLARSSTEDLQFELDSVSHLRSRYEEGLRQNEALREHLEKEINSINASKQSSNENEAEDLMTAQLEIKKLQCQLEDLEQWNKSLQARLDQASPPNGADGESHKTDLRGGNPFEADIAEMVERLRKERDELQERLKKQQAECALLRKELREGGQNASEAEVELAEFKLHYERFSQLRNKELESLTSNCEEAKTVIKNLESEIAALSAELSFQRKSQRDADDVERNREATAKQIIQIDEVNVLLRKELNEKILELNNMKQELKDNQEVINKLKKKSELFEKDKDVLMKQLEEKNAELQKSIENGDKLTRKIAMVEEEKEQLEKQNRDFNLLQQDRNELRVLNERLRNKLGEVSKTYENLKGTNDGELLALADELKKANARIAELEADNEEAKSIAVRLRDEIRNLQQASRGVQRLTDELRNSENVNRVLQRQLNEVAKAAELRKNSVDPEIELVKKRMHELQTTNADLQEKLREYERQFNGLRNELSKERSVSLVERNGLEVELRRLVDELASAEEMKKQLEQNVKELSYINKTYKDMIESLEDQNKKKDDIKNMLEKELSRQKVCADIATSMTPQKSAPTRPVSTNTSQLVEDVTLQEAIQKRDAYIAALRHQLEFYKQEKQNTATAKQYSGEESSKDKTDNLIAMHIAEMRELRRELEQSIRNNDALREQLEHRLSQAEKEAAQFKDPQMRASLLRENDALRARISERDLRIENMKAELEKAAKTKIESLNSSFSGLQIKPKEFESTRLELNHLQRFAPQETSSALVSPLSSITAFTQTTPRNKTYRNQESQADTTQIAARTRETQKQIDSLKEQVKNKTEVINTLEQTIKSMGSLREDYNMLQVEYKRLKSSVVEKDRLIESLQNDLKTSEEPQRSLMPTGIESSDRYSTSDGLHEKQTNEELIALHIAEMRGLKKELELSIKNNDSLRAQLEHRLTMVERDAENIKDPQLRAHVIRDNDILRTQSMERQTVVKKQKSRIDELMKERQSDKEKIRRLHQQIHELSKLTTNLQEEVSLYDRLQEQLNATVARNKTISSSPGNDKASENAANAASGFDASLLQMLLEEIRILRRQLQKSIDANIALREKLEQQLDSPLDSSKITSANTDRDLAAGIATDARSNTIRRALFASEFQQDIEATKSNENSRYGIQETPTKENGSPGENSYLLSPSSLATVYSDAKREQVFVRGKIEDYVMLKNKLDNCFQRVSLMQNVHAILHMHKSVSKTQVNDLISEAEKISLDLKECHRLLDLMKPEDACQNGESKDPATTAENQQLKMEIISLKKKLCFQDKLIKSSLQRLEESNKLKSDLERKLLEKLKTTHGTMIKASQNLEDKIVKAKTPTK
eukprot:gene15801-17394_t